MASITGYRFTWKILYIALFKINYVVKLHFLMLNNLSIGSRVVLISFIFTMIRMKLDGFSTDS